jgi:hypothetical protein
LGLTAIVYTNRKLLELGNDAGLAQRVPETGEVYFQNDEIARKYKPQLEAAQHRLGNIAEINGLREEAMRYLGPESVILQKVLYSETHSGDFLHVELMVKLLAELDSIGNDIHQSSALRHFVASLKQLARASKHEDNPIVFV